MSSPRRFLQHKLLSIIATSTFVLSFAQILPAKADACTPPADLQREIMIRFPGTELVRLPDLDPDDRAFFLKDHHDACPGLVNVDFYGDGKPTFALVLKTKDRTELVVAHNVEKKWTMAVLDTGDLSAPVVWSQAPGEYSDVYGNKRIRSPRPVIVFCKYESWAILYAWTGKKVTKIWIED